MIQFKLGNKEYELVDVKVVDETGPIFEIDEGEYKGVQFRLIEMKMGEEVDDGSGDAMLNYQVEHSEGVTIEQIKPIIDTFILHIMYEQMVRVKKNEDKTTK